MDRSKYIINGQPSATKDFFEDVVSEMNELNSKTQNLPNNGSFNPLTNQSQQVSNLTLAQVLLLAINKPYVGTINAISSTREMYFQKVGASSGGGIFVIQGTFTTSPYETYIYVGTANGIASSKRIDNI